MRVFSDMSGLPPLFPISFQFPNCWTLVPTVSRRPSSPTTDFTAVPIYSTFHRLKNHHPNSSYHYSLDFSQLLTLSPAFTRIHFMLTYSMYHCL